MFYIHKRQNQNKNKKKNLSSQDPSSFNFGKW